jgi:hypothetical protein
MPSLQSLLSPGPQYITFPVFSSHAWPVPGIGRTVQICAVSRALPGPKDNPFENRGSRLEELGLTLKTTVSHREQLRIITYW